MTPDEGSVRLAGEDITGLTPEARARRGLVRSFQAARLFPTMSVPDVVRSYLGGEPAAVARSGDLTSA